MYYGKMNVSKGGKTVDPEGTIGGDEGERNKETKNSMRSRSYIAAESTSRADRGHWPSFWS